MGDWELSYPGELIRFGSPESGLGFVGAPEITTPEILDGDAQAVYGDGRLFGVDRLGGGLVTFELDAYCATEAEARDRLERVRRAWRADAVRRTPGTVAKLISGRRRVTFGRPRRFSSEDTQIPNGFVSILADFSTTTDLWFGPPQEDAFTFSPAVYGGFTFPLAFPAVTTARQNKATVLPIGGELPTPHLVFEVRGPIVQPVIEIENVARLEFDLTVRSGEILVIDARPWVRTITIGRGSRAGSLTPKSTRLRDLTLPPGEHVTVLSGVPSASSARLTTQWRDAYTTP